MQGHFFSSRAVHCPAVSVTRAHSRVRLWSFFRLTSQSYNTLSCSMIHSSRTSLFRSSFLSYFTVTLPCFFWTVSSPLIGPDPTQPTPGAPWKKTRLPAVGKGALVSVLAADIARCAGVLLKKCVDGRGGLRCRVGTACCTADGRMVRSF